MPTKRLKHERRQQKNLVCQEFYGDIFQVRKKEMLRLMAKRKRSEVKVISSSDKELKTKRTRMVDEQERLDQLEKRLESKVIYSQLLRVVRI